MTTDLNLPTLNRSIKNTTKYPTKVLQFGDGNFLRAFIDWMFFELNNSLEFNAGITIIKARPGQGKLPILKEQEGLYTLLLKGIHNGEIKNENKIIDCINQAINPYDNFNLYFEEAANPELQFLVSNTTEAGIVFDATDKLTDTPQKSFPGKVTAFLYKRFQIFNGDTEKGLIFLPCELIEKNGTKLRDIILKYASLWKLESEFITWVQENNTFCNTLVDRIVSGYPKDSIDTIQQKLGYTDQLVVEGEQYHLLVIESEKNIEDKFPAHKIGLNVIFTENLERYKTIKVRILNGAHTSLVPVAYLYGIDRVRESIEDAHVGQFLNKLISEEICPTLNFTEQELSAYTNDVLDRFKNPYIEHELLSISLNSISKFTTRVLPSLLEFIKRKDTLPKGILFSLSALIIFYRGLRNEKPYPVNDSTVVLDFFKKQWATENIGTIVKATLSNESFWGTDLTQYEGLEKQVVTNINSILNNGMINALQNLYTF